jgi:hypothetical protein
LSLSFTFFPLFPFPLSPIRFTFPF